MKRRSSYGVYELIVGILLILLGIFTFTRPQSALTGLVVLYGLLATITGIGDIVFYVKMEKHTGFGPTVSLISGILSVMTGLVLMVQNLEGMGFTVVPFGQGFKDMSPPTKELMKLVLEQRIAHGGHSVLRWMMDNIFIRTDPAGNIKPDKEKSTEKIDGAVATIMALDRAIRCGNDNGASVYDSRGLLFV